MKKIYEEVLSYGKVSSIRKVETGELIPLDENNSDYQEYLNWLENGR